MRIVDSAILHVIKLWIKAPVIGEDKDGTKKNVGGGKANSKGTLAVRRHFPSAGKLLHRNSSDVLGKVRTHAEERLRTHLMKRHKVKDRGTGLGRFPRQLLYTRYGLCKVPTTAGWKSAYA